MPERPLLTAQWRNLLLLNFPVPADLMSPTETWSAYLREVVVL